MTSWQLWRGRWTIRARDRRPRLSGGRKALYKSVDHVIRITVFRGFLSHVRRDQKISLPGQGTFSVGDDSRLIGTVANFPPIWTTAYVHFTENMCGNRKHVGGTERKEGRETGKTYRRRQSRVNLEACKCARDLFI
jgi:hypothetical protein